MSASDWTMQFLADMLDAPVDRPEVLETTALGAAFLAGWQAGLFPGPEEFARTWRSQRRFTPTMPRGERESRYRGWRDAVARVVAPSTAQRTMQIVFRCDPAMLDYLIRPTPARHALPDWLRTMPRTAFSETHGQDVRTVKQCPPFVDAMAHGFVIPLPCDVACA